MLATESLQPRHPTSEEGAEDVGVRTRYITVVSKDIFNQVTRAAAQVHTNQPFIIDGTFEIPPGF
jgi:hypothetical protein